ncbi:MgtC/SapB family protein [Methylomicrobium lacus]|uniref:MgtC/SapB family protein n=1 Tax=Methylomicrobium lacus TaxID=136992 RepID=UPI0035A8D100
MEFTDTIPPLLIQFAMTVAFAFVVGLEFRRYHQINQYQLHFGSTRTFVLIAIQGFILYSLDPAKLLFAVGFLLLGAALLVYYWHLASKGIFSIFSPLLALLIYLIGPAAIAFPNWFLILFVVVLILILGEKPVIHRFSDQLANDEVVTLAKFLIISGVILPLLPDRPIAPSLPVTYDKVWLAVIIVSGFSYLSYLLHSYLFKSRGLMVTAVLAGLYSSTVATVVIGRRARNLAAAESHVSAALIIATTMMYLRLLALIFLFNPHVAVRLLPPFALIIALSLIAAAVLCRYQKPSLPFANAVDVQHPLELSTAALFAVLFVVFTFVTHYVTSHFGSNGLNILAIAVGLTDIDPFILALLSGQFPASEAAIVAAVVMASGSNNLLKAAYSLFFARNVSVRFGALWLTALFVASAVYAKTLTI